MAAAVGPDERISALEARERELVAQLERERITAEQNAAAIEERYSSLQAELAKACASRDAAEKSAADSRNEFARQKKEAIALEVRIIELEKDSARGKVEIRELHSDKQSLLHILEQRKGELEEKNSSISSYLDKVVALTNEKSEVESKLRESEREETKFEVVKARLEQENALLKQHNDWLNEELGAKSTVLLEDRKRASDEIVHLKTKIVDVENLLEQKTRSLSSTEKQLEQNQSNLASAEEEVLNLKHKVSSQEALFEKEIGTAKRLINLYQDTSEKGTAKIAELEGIVEELQVHMKEAAKTSDERVREAEERARDLEQKCAEYKGQVDRTVEAASQGRIPAAATPIAGTPTTSSASAHQLRQAGETAMQVLEMSPAAAAATMMKEGMSLTDMYTKYVEMSDAWRQERSDKKKIQGYLDAILDELERKAPLINEQKAEYERLMDSHDALAKRLEDAINERGVLESAITKARSDAQRSAREKRSMEGQAEDLSRQVQVLLKEVEDMKAGRAVLGGSQPIQAMQSGATPTTASDVITDHLVEFKSIKDLQEQNKRLLAVARQLGEDNEQKISDVRKTLQEDHSKEVESIKAQVASLAQQKQQQEELVNQVLRQRDLYKSLLSEKEGANAAGGGSPAFGNSNSGGADIAVAQDHKQMYLDLQKDYDKFKFENGENLRMLRDEVYKYREEAGVARGEKTQLQAQISFERERHERLSEVCASHAKEIESLVQRNAGLISKLTQHEQRLKDLSFDQDVTKDDLRREKERNVSLRAERDLLEKSEKRLSGEMAAAVAEKHRHQASVESLIQRYGEQEKAWAKERERILAENQKMQESWAEAQKRLLEESTRSRDALSASSNLAADTAARIATLEVELKTTAKAKDEAEQKVSAALANVENLQGSLQKAEEKAALAVMRSTTMAQEASQDQAQAQTTGTESDVISKLKAQLKSAQNDAGSAQEAAAAAAGHLAQYKAMCAASDQALAAMKEAHEGFKAQAQATADAAQADLEAARAALTKAEEEVAQKRSVDAEEEKKRLAQEEVLISENAKMREEAARLQKQLELTGEKVAALQTDIKDYHQQWRNAKSMYDNELIAHAADVKRLGAAQEEADRVKQEVSSVKAERDDAKAGAAQMQSEKASLAAKVEEIKRQNHILHEELEAATLKAVASMEQRMDLAASGAGQSSESTEIQQVVQYLRKEKETIDCQLSLVQQENVRLRKQVEYALQRADAADQRLEQSRKQKMDEDDHEKALKDIESLNLLRESNAGLRDENGKLQTRLRDLTKAKADSEAALTPLKEQVARMQALLDSKEDEVKSIKDQSSRWEARTQNLLDKYGQVDLGEYQRVVRALAEAEKGKEKVEERVAGAVKAAMEARTKELADTKTALEKAKAQEQIAKKQIFNIFNPTRLSIPQWIQERDAARKKAEDMEQAMAASKEKEREGEDAFKAREKELRAEAEEAKAAKNDLQLKVLEKLKRAKETRLTLVQKVKSLEKQLKGKQSGSGQEGEAKPATAKAKKSAQKKRERESPLKTKETPKKKAKKPQEEQEPSPAATQASPEVADPPPSAEPTPMAADEAATHPEAPQDAPAEAEAAPEAAAAGSGAEADAEATTDAEEAAPDAAEEADVEAREEEEPAKEEAEEAPPKEEEEAAPAKDEGGEGHHQTESEADAPEKQDPPELNPMASPFTPSKAAMAAASGAEEAGQEEVEEGGDPEDEEVVDPAYEDEVTDQGETEIEEDAPENEADTAAEDQVLADQDDAAEAEPKAASKPKPISWKGGKKSAGKKAAAAAAAASPVVSKEAVKQAKKSAAAATRGGKSGIRKKIAKKKKQGTEGGKKT